MASRNLLLFAAIAAALDSQPRPVDIEYALRGKVKDKSLSRLKLEGVPPGHPNYPEAKKFNVVGETCYVRIDELAPLQAALAKRRGE